MMISREEPSRPVLFAAAGCFCLHGNNVLLLRRSDDKSYPGHWGVPTGRLEAGEDGIRAVIRELYEETRLLLSQDRLISLGTFYVTNDDMAFTYALFLAQFDHCPQVTINSEEHNEYRWADLDSLGGFQLVPDVADCAAVVREYLLPAAQLQLLELPSVAPTSTLRRIQAEVEQQLPPHSNGSVMEHCLSVLGPPAAGKSTALKQIASVRKDYKYIRDDVILRQGSRLNRYLTQLIDERRRAIALNFQVDILAVRYWQSTGAPKYALIDESIHSSLAYAKALWYMEWLDDASFQTFYVTYATYARTLPAAEVTVLLTADIDVLMSRIHRRGRKAERSYDERYVNEVRRGCEEVAVELERTQYVKRIDTSDMTAKGVSEYLLTLLSG